MSIAVSFVIKGSYHQPYLSSIWLQWSSLDTASHCHSPAVLSVCYDIEQSRGFSSQQDKVIARIHVVGQSFPVIFLVIFLLMSWLLPEFSAAATKFVFLSCSHRLYLILIWSGPAGAVYFFLFCFACRFPWILFLLSNPV